MRLCPSRQYFSELIKPSRNDQDKSKIGENISPFIEPSAEGSVPPNIDSSTYEFRSKEDKCDDIKVEEAGSAAMSNGPEVEEDDNGSSDEEDPETPPPTESGGETSSFKADVIDNDVKNGLNLLEALKSRLDNDVAEWPQLGKWIDELGTYPVLMARQTLTGLQML